MDREGKINKYSVLQHDSTDCGSACLVSLIRYFGGEATIEEIRNISGTSQSGTSLLGLYQAAEKSGLRATGFEASVDDIIDYNNVLILHVRPEQNYDHYVVYYGLEREKYIIWDPASGMKKLTRDELERLWVSKKCLAVVPGDNFRMKNQEKKKKLKWLIDIIKPEKDLLLTSVLLGIVISILGMVMALFTQKLIDKILPSGEPRSLLIASMLVFVLLSSRILFSSIRQYFLLSQGKSFNIRIVDDFYSALLDLPKYFFDTRKTGDFIARLYDTTRVQRVIAEIVTVYIIDFLIIGITLGLFFFYSEVVGLISLISIPVLYFIIQSWNKRIIDSQYSVMTGYALSESNFINSLKGIAEIKSMNWQDHYSEKNKTIYADYQDRAFSFGKIRVKLNLIAGISGTAYIIIILIYASLQVMQSNLTQGELMAILTLSSTILPSVLNLSLLSIPLSEVKVAVNRMFEFTRISPEGVVRSEGEPSDVKIRKILLKDLSFRFPGQKLLLDRISLNIERGKISSLAGECGSGKSTLANLILRFYSPESGQIIVNDSQQAQEIDLRTWRSKVGVIPQEVHIFNGTILQNLISDYSEERINEMTAMISEFGLTEFVNSFPAGLLTIVGEEGINLSGGQKQILAFIRVLMNKPDILIVDEGTSNMDSKTEDLIVSLVTRLKSTMGILLISHRLNIIKKLSDYIYVLENGRITTQGSHNELITTNNLYSSFWKDFY